MLAPDQLPWAVSQPVCPLDNTQDTCKVWWSSSFYKTSKRMTTNLVFIKKWLFLLLLLLLFQKRVCRLMYHKIPILWYSPLPLVNNQPIWILNTIANAIADQTNGHSIRVIEPDARRIVAQTRFTPEPVPPFVRPPTSNVWTKSSPCVYFLRK